MTVIEIFYRSLFAVNIWPLDCILFRFVDT